MTRQALSLEEARAICKDFQQLVGRTYSDSKSWTPVISVVVAPFEDVNKWIFSRYYAEGRNAENALSFYPGPNYEVLVFTCSVTNPKWLAYTDVRTYLENNSLPFDINQYHYAFR